MAGNKPSKALASFIEPLQRALSCVTPSVIVRSAKSNEPGGVRGLLMPKGTDFAPLRGANRLHLSVAMEYELVKTEDPDRGPWKVSTRQYRYHVVNDAMDEIILFHWLPLGRCSTKEPHMHLGQSQLTRDAVMTRKQHLPTGRLSLETVIETLITEFNVVPLRGDWQEVLDQGRQDFRTWRTWG